MDFASSELAHECILNMIDSIEDETTGEMNKVCLEIMKQTDAGDLLKKAAQSDDADIQDVAQELLDKLQPPEDAKPAAQPPAEPAAADPPVILPTGVPARPESTQESEPAAAAEAPAEPAEPAPAAAAEPPAEPAEPAPAAAEPVAEPE